MKLWLLIFFGTLTLVRRAQRNNHFANSKMDGNGGVGNPTAASLGIFPNEEHGVTTLRDSVEEGNMQRVVAILQSNIKQWSFIEAQLLEPNVNLGMPEIFIPLKHLTTTLEILGNIFFMRNELTEAKSCLERACPLMELLPAALLENNGAGGIGNVGDFGLSEEVFGEEHFRSGHRAASRAAGSGNGIGSDNPSIGGNGNTAGINGANNYATECFALLRNVYVKLYGTAAAAAAANGGGRGNLLDLESYDDDPVNNEHWVDEYVDEELSSTTRSSTSTEDVDMDDVYDDDSSSTTDSTTHASTGNTKGGSSSSSGKGIASKGKGKSSLSFDVEDLDDFDYDDDYEDIHMTRSQSGSNGNTIHTSHSDHTIDEDDDYLDDLLDDHESTSNHKKSAISSSSNKKNQGTSSSGKVVSTKKKANRSGFDRDIATKIEELRSPFQHLRSELLMIHGKGYDAMSNTGDYYEDSGNGNNGGDSVDFDFDLIEESLNDDNTVPSTRSTRSSPSSAPSGPSSSHGSSSSPSSHGSSSDSSSRKSAFAGTNDNSASSSSNQKRAPSSSSSSSSSSGSPSSKGKSQRPSNAFFEGLQHGQSGNNNGAMNPALSDDPMVINIGGSATSIIASDLEVMLRRFVEGDTNVQMELYEVAKKYYDELDINFPQMDDHEYAANMDFGKAYLDIMLRVVEEGFGFISQEIEKWKDLGQNALLNSFAENGVDITTGGHHHPSNGLNDNNINGKKSGKKKQTKDLAIEIGETFFDSFSLDERNRMLVLSAFDITLSLEPYEHFDLSLGFSLGILDNDRSRSQSMSNTMNSRNIREPTAVPKSRESTKQRRRTSSPSSSGNTASSANGNTGSGNAANGKNEDVPAGMFEDQTIASINLAAAALRSSVPTLKAEDDWTLPFLLFFMLLTAIVIYIAYRESEKKKADRSSNRNLRGSKKSSSSKHSPLLMQDGLLPYLYYMLSISSLSNGGMNDYEPPEGGNASITVTMVIWKAIEVFSEFIVMLLQELIVMIKAGITEGVNTISAAIQARREQQALAQQRAAENHGIAMANAALLNVANQQSQAMANGTLTSSGAGSTGQPSNAAQPAAQKKPNVSVPTPSVSTTGTGDKKMTTNNPRDRESVVAAVEALKREREREKLEKAEKERIEKEKAEKEKEKAENHKKSAPLRSALKRDNSSSIAPPSLSVRIADPSDTANNAGSSPVPSPVPVVTPSPGSVTNGGAFFPANASTSKTAADGKKGKTAKNTGKTNTSSAASPAPAASSSVASSTAASTTEGSEKDSSARTSTESPSTDLQAIASTVSSTGNASASSPVVGTSGIGWNQISSDHKKNTTATTATATVKPTAATAVKTTTTTASTVTAATTTTKTATAATSPVTTSTTQGKTVPTPDTTGTSPVTITPAPSTMTEPVITAPTPAPSPIKPKLINGKPSFAAAAAGLTTSGSGSIPIPTAPMVVPVANDDDEDTVSDDGSASSASSSSSSHASSTSSSSLSDTDLTKLLPPSVVNNNRRPGFSESKAITAVPTTIAIDGSEAAGWQEAKPKGKASNPVKNNKSTDNLAASVNVASSGSSSAGSSWKSVSSTTTSSTGAPSINGPVTILTRDRRNSHPTPMNATAASAPATASASDKTIHSAANAGKAPPNLTPPSTAAATTVSPAKSIPVPAASTASTAPAAPPGVKKDIGKPPSYKLAVVAPPGTVPTPAAATTTSGLAPAPGLATGSGSGKEKERDTVHQPSATAANVASAAATLAVPTMISAPQPSKPLGSSLPSSLSSVPLPAAHSVPPSIPPMLPVENESITSGLGLSLPSLSGLFSHSSPSHSVQLRGPSLPPSLAMPLPLSLPLSGSGSNPPSSLSSFSLGGPVGNSGVVGGGSSMLTSSKPPPGLSLHSTSHGAPGLGVSNNGVVGGGSNNVGHLHGHHNLYQDSFAAGLFSTSSTSSTTSTGMLGSDTLFGGLGLGSGLMDWGLGSSASSGLGSSSLPPSLFPTSSSVNSTSTSSNSTSVLGHSVRGVKSTLTSASNEVEDDWVQNFLLDEPPTPTSSTSALSSGIASIGVSNPTSSLFGGKHASDDFSLSGFSRTTTGSSAVTGNTTNNSLFSTPTRQNNKSTVSQNTATTTATASTATTTNGTASDVVSDLSPHAPVFLPSNLLSPTGPPISTSLSLVANPGAIGASTEVLPKHLSADNNDLFAVHVHGRSHTVRDRRERDNVDGKPSLK